MLLSLHLKTIKIMEKEKIELVKSVVKGIIENTIDNYINYEWEGSDFVERINSELPDFQVEEKKGEFFFDDNSYHLFVNSITDFICSTLKEK